MLKNYINSDCITNISFYESIKDIVTCNLCLGILINPIECSSCESSFCKSCIEEWRNFNEICPYKCNKNEVRESPRMLKELLEKLTFKCLFCDKIEKNASYRSFLIHINICEKLKVYCPSCDSYVFKNKLIEDKQFKKLNENYESLKKNYKNLQDENEKLVKEIHKLKDVKGGRRASLKNNSLGINPLDNNNELGIIDKCEHFKGNYIPIFSCCEKSYPCYICHNKNQNHDFFISNKVICLICKNIYTGPKCDVCNTYQVYRKKKFESD